ncbi:MAG: glycerophosphodiester phosphodiesterase [Luteolibacter sp.]|jgi:glycerophosphoryl diester phosphodiesterase|nr:glycerophosphodiester phosphodiesterase [Luteolibacter sp.]
MKTTTILTMAFCAFASAEPVSVRWSSNPEAVDGYRIYKGDANGRVFIKATTDTKAFVDIADGDSLFVAASRGVLESQPSEALVFKLQESNDLRHWDPVAQPSPSGAQYFTRFKVQTVAQTVLPTPTNAAILPQKPLDPGVNPAPGSTPPPDQMEIQAPGIRDLPTPWIIAHRGGWNVAPEHTLEAYRMCVASGIKFIEPDVQILPDGTAVVMHDSMIDRTTTGTGNVTNQTGDSWQSLVNDDGKRLQGWATNLRCPTFDDVLKEFGNRVVIVPEAKSAGAGAAIVLKLQEFKIRQDMVIIQSPSLSELAAGVAAGYPCMRMSNTNYAETSAAGIEFTGFGWNETAKIEAATAAGLKVIVWTTKRNVDLDSALAAGAIAAFSDDPVYQAGLHRTNHDPYGSKAIYHGDLREPSVAVTLDTAESAIMVPTKTLPHQDTILLGWASPVVNPENFVLDFSMKFAAVSSDSGYGLIATQTTDRAITNDNPEAGKISMNMILRRDGRIGLYVFDGAAGGPGAVSSESPVPAELIPLDTWVPCRLAVTPTQITLQRLDTAVSATIANRQIRGAYLFAGAKNADVKFKSMTLTE